MVKKIVFSPAARKHFRTTHRAEAGYGRHVNAIALTAE
jgi:hypothetical protein